MKTLGVIGGLGPLATAQFMEMVVRMTDALHDRDHIPMIINSQPATPDRTRFILGQSKESPLPTMIRTGQELSGMGVEYIAIPCVTAYFFYDQLTASIPVPIIDLIGETALHLRENQVTRAGLMATDGTLAGGFFRQRLESAGIEVVEPSAANQQLVMKIIYDHVKANQPVDMADFATVGNELRRQGAQVILLGCTELSSIHRDRSIGSGYLNVMAVQARKAVLLCGARLNPAFSKLIT
ncbi:MAG: aspartate/glutamate racemase family protein [Saccharofermentanales bacterium]|jgi:aspartate racemase